MQNNIGALLRQGSHYIAGRVGVVLVGLFSFTLFTRIFTVSEYGIVSLALKIGAFGAVFGKAGLQNAVLRFQPEYAQSSDSQSLPRFYSTILFGVAANAVAICLLFAGGLTLVSRSFVSDGLTGPLLLASLFMLSRPLQSIVWAFLRVEGFSRMYSLLDVALRAGSAALAALLVISWHWGVRGFMTGILLAEGLIVGFVLVWFVFFRNLRLSLFDVSLFRSMWAYSLPLISYELSGMLLDSGDRILIQYFLGPEALGYYAAAFNLSTYIEEALILPLGLAIVPMYMKLWNTEGEAATRSFLSRVFNGYLILAIGIGTTAVTVSSDLIVVLGSSKLRAAGDLFPYLVAGLLLYSTYVFLNAGLLIHKKTGLMAKLLMLCAALNMILNVVLQPRFGLKGAAVASLISFATFIVILGWQSFRLMRLDVHWRNVFQALLLGAALSWAAGMIQLPSPILGLLCKSVAVLGLYGGALLMFNRRIREPALSWLRQVLHGRGG
jgi:O-antigen/teichoic acid export membrane protein